MGNADKRIVAYVKKHSELAKKYAMKMYKAYTGRKWKAFTTCPLCGKKLESPVTNMEGWMNRYSWKDLSGTIVQFPPFEKSELALLQFVLKQKKEMDEAIYKYVEDYLFGEKDEIPNH